MRSRISWTTFVHNCGLFVQHPATGDGKFLRTQISVRTRYVAGNNRCHVLNAINGFTRKRGVFRPKEFNFFRRYSSIITAFSDSWDDTLKYAVWGEGFPSPHTRFKVRQRVLGQRPHSSLTPRRSLLLRPRRLHGDDGCACGDDARDAHGARDALNAHGDEAAHRWPRAHRFRHQRRRTG